MKAILVGGVVLVAALTAAIALPRSELVGLLDLERQTLAPPPEIRLLSPTSGEGVGGTVTIRGSATSETRDVIDVQYRVDGERWTSIPDLARGQPATAFSIEVALAPGDHVLEARAWDGDAYSHVARALVRRDAPTVRILAPADGDGLPAGDVIVRGIVEGSAHRVIVIAGGTSANATLTGGTWNATLALPPGLHTIAATAYGALPSLAARIEVAAAERTPPTLSIRTPQDGDAYGQAGDPACVGGCILFSGSVRGAPPIRAALDGFPAGEATLSPTGGAWTYRLPILQVGSGTHVATFTPEGGVPRSVTFLARTPNTLEVRGDLAPRLTQRPLSFHVVGEGADDAAWSLDGSPVARGPAATIHLATPGDHALDVRVPLAGGRAASASVPLHALNRAPSVELAEPSLVGARIHLAATANDPDGRVVAYDWEFGDGTRATTRDAQVAHRYLARGLHVANVTAIDDHGATARASIPVLVPNVLPLADFTWEPVQPTTLDVVTFRDASVDLDGSLVSRLWVFDGASTSENATPSLRFGTRGPHLVTLRVLDDLGAEGLVAKLIDVGNVPPTARFSWQPPLPRAHEEVLFFDNSTDPDGPLRVRAWRFPDGSTATGPGALHTFRTPGIHNVTLAIEDDVGAIANVTLPVHVVDSEPVVTAVAHEPLRPVAKQEVRFRVLAADRDGDLVALFWDFGDGTNSSLLEPTHRYARRGTYAANVTVYDAAGLSTTFPFLVEVENAPPTATLALLRGGYAALPTTLVANASDPDGRIALYRFDPDGDGDADCETTEPTCTFHYEEARPHLARVWVEDDAAAIVEAQIALDILAPPSHLAPPRVRIEAPTPHATLRGDHLLRGDAQGVRPIAKIEIQLRNDTWAYSGSKDPWRLANGGATWSSLIDTRSFADGDYELVIRATDTQGGQGHARIPIRVLNGPRPSDVTLQLLDPPTTLDDDATIRGSAFHPQGVTNVRWRIDDAPWRYIGTSPLAFTITIDTDHLQPGNHLLLVEAYRGPHEKTILQHNFLLTGAAPNLIIDETPAPIAYGLLHAKGRIHGPGHAEWRLDHDIWRPIPGGTNWNLTHETGRIQGGQHTLQIRAMSPDGKHASAPRNWTIQIVNPPFHTTGEATPVAQTPPVVEVPAAGWAWAVAAAVAAIATRRRYGGT